MRRSAAPQLRLAPSARKRTRWLPLKRPVALHLVDDNRNRPSRRVAIARDVRRHLFGRNAHLLPHRSADSVVGLMRHEPVDVVERDVRRRADLAHDPGKERRGVFEETLPFIVGMWESVIAFQGRRRMSIPAGTQAWSAAQPSEWFAPARRSAPACGLLRSTSAPAPVPKSTAVPQSSSRRLAPRAKLCASLRYRRSPTNASARMPAPLRRPQTVRTRD